MNRGVVLDAIDLVDLVSPETAAEVAALAPAERDDILRMLNRGGLALPRPAAPW